jgi:hypothetical protein
VLNEIWTDLRVTIHIVCQEQDLGMRLQEAKEAQEHETLSHKKGQTLPVVASRSAYCQFGR